MRIIIRRVGRGYGWVNFLRIATENYLGKLLIFKQVTKFYKNYCILPCANFRKYGIIVNINIYILKIYMLLRKEESYVCNKQTIEKTIYINSLPVIDWRNITLASPWGRRYKQSKTYPPTLSDGEMWGITSASSSMSLLRKVFVHPCTHIVSALYIYVNQTLKT